MSESIYEPFSLCDLYDGCEHDVKGLTWSPPVRETVPKSAPQYKRQMGVQNLGRELKLPPWEEPHRAEIEAGLATIAYRAS
jgi:hypothetical protein